ncbi:unnamed protein product [Protopolystoma xenopodis]|uniref:Uncharacterized protein n=1 Tax=Protopolystoma xenopodis TaxID=117903 RepID=A0A3S5BN40_9PLAT|nr:unnamed protein product [Protopolystoma xenopodis]
MSNSDRILQLTPPQEDQLLLDQIMIDSAKLKPPICTAYGSCLLTHSTYLDDDGANVPLIYQRHESPSPSSPPPSETTRTRCLVNKSSESELYHDLEK